MEEKPISDRADVVTRRTYNRPLNEDETRFETWDQTVERVMMHQDWLWVRAAGSAGTNGASRFEELEDLSGLVKDRLASPAGRTLWLGGTEVGRKREASQFNCSFLQVQTVHDVVDAFWLLLQGCGVGFEPVTGTLNGFPGTAEVKIVRSQKTQDDPKGRPENDDFFSQGEDNLTIYNLHVGDSAEAWAKAIGKLLALKTPVDRIVVDFSEVRAPGLRLSGYGWICSGDEAFAKAVARICEILNARAGELLTRIDILDLMNHLGTTLSSRRSAEIALVPFTDPEALPFAKAKKDFWLHDNFHRQQSNNSLMFHSRPSEWELEGIFAAMQEGGGSEPGFINAEAALRRAPWFKGVNPCAEILLGDKSFCNLVTVNWGALADDFSGLLTAIYLISRANYRQTCVNLDDGVLQRTWHELNEFLRLCGVSGTGIVTMLDKWRRDGLTEAMIARRLRIMREAAWRGACTMADELGLPHPKAVTTVKPEGTVSKIMDSAEGLHRPLGKYMFNNIKFSVHDPVVEKLRTAGYAIIYHPQELQTCLVKFPVSYPDIDFDVDADGKEVNLESAVEQLERYKLLMDNYVDHNASITVSYSPDEVPAIIRWIRDNWDSYVGVSFIYRNDPSKTAADLGFPYLPQEVVTKEQHDAYLAGLQPVNLDGTSSLDGPEDSDCGTGGCPIR